MFPYSRALITLSIDIPRGYCLPSEEFTVLIKVKGLRRDLDCYSTKMSTDKSERPQTGFGLIIPLPFHQNKHDRNSGGRKMSRRGAAGIAIPFTTLATATTIPGVTLAAFRT
ncbi:hypothetical protein J6590_015090 [Homalodisca vitripennis]|nr:hypothetical protein J6590_015090 [Homalodisca vitripennis]